MCDFQTFCCNVLLKFVGLHQLEMKQEILMLLAKIRYALGDHQGALDRLEEVALDTLPLSDISSRKMKLMGESFAIRGRCFQYFCIVHVNIFQIH